MGEHRGQGRSSGEGSAARGGRAKFEFIDFTYDLLNFIYVYFSIKYIFTPFINYVNDAGLVEGFDEKAYEAAKKKEEIT